MHSEPDVQRFSARTPPAESAAARNKVHLFRGLKDCQAAFTAPSRDVIPGNFTVMSLSFQSW